MLRNLKVGLFFIFAFFFSSCVPFTKAEQSSHPDFVTLQQGDQIGQTFVARYDGLQGISLFLKSNEINSGNLSLELFEENERTAPLREVSLSSDSFSSPGFYEFTFQPIPASTGKIFYFQLSSTDGGSIKVGSAPGNTYLSGAQYYNDSAQNSQSAFRLDYRPLAAFGGLIKEVFRWLWLLCAAFVLFALPGWAALTWLYPPWSSTDWFSKLALSIGIGIALYPILFLWTNTIGINLGYLYAWIPPILALISIVFHSLQKRQRQADSEEHYADKTVPQKTKKRSWEERFPDIIFALLMLLVIFTRFWPIRVLDAPMWGDSYQHTMITQLLVDNGGLFSSWLPYAELDSFTYHFGFHSLAAVVQWLTKISVIQSTLWTGQILNIMAIFALYPLAMVIGKSKWAGILTVVIAAFISPMPMYYLNWGRYTQLAGQVILPVVTVIIWSNLDSREGKAKWYSLIWLGLAGLVLTHYRVTLFIPLFYVAYFLLNFRAVSPLETIKKTALHVVGVVILVIPWGVRVFQGTLPNIFGTQITASPVETTQTNEVFNTIGDITGYLPIYLWILAAACILIGIWQHNRKSNIFSLWWIFILLAANPNWLRLPGSGILTNFAVFIAAYIPASLIISAGIVAVLLEGDLIPGGDKFTGEYPAERKKLKYLLTSGVLSLGVILISVWFILPRIRSIQPAQHALLTRPDMRASSWINENLLADGKFMVNSFFAYGGTLVVGSDGGWWLPMTTAHLTSQPPLTYGSEHSIHPDFVAATNSLVALIEENGIDSKIVISELKKREFSHVYIGQQQGQVNASGPPILNLDKLLNSPAYDPIYHEDRVWIFEILE